MLEIIKKKRDGYALSKEEIEEFIQGMTSGEIPDYQTAAFLMAVYFQDMDETETAYLTQAVLESGEQIDLSEIEGIKVDKHSTGGVGDKTTIVLAPLIASFGVPLAKMSGRGLGHTGGTIDKLEAIDGFSVDMSITEFKQKLKQYNIAICGQSENLVPADKKLYALRDITGTVNNLALITSSIMGKKLACGADAIVIDLKVGEGAFMKTIEEATKLANTMIKTGAKMDRDVVVVLSAMNQPLGYAVGNALELKEAIAALQGNGPDDLMELVYELGAVMLMLAKKANDISQGKIMLREHIDNGKAYRKFLEFVKSQGGDATMIENVDLLPSCDYSRDFTAKTSGYLTQINALEVGIASVSLGAGRETKASVIDMGAGIVLNNKIGDKVEKGDIIARQYTSNEDNFIQAEKHLSLAMKIEFHEPEIKSIILKTILKT